MKLFPAPYATVLKLVTIVSVLALGSAYIAEYAFGFKACKLCIYQRVPYFILIVISVTGWTINKPHLSKILNYICGIILFVGFLIALYHVGVEHGIINEPCSVTDAASNLNALKNLILNHTVSCKDIPFKILGLSMAEINAILSLILTILIFHNTRSTHTK